MGEVVSRQPMGGGLHMNIGVVAAPPHLVPTLRFLITCVFVLFCFVLFSCPGIH